MLMLTWIWEESLRGDRLLEDKAVLLPKDIEGLMKSVLLEGEGMLLNRVLLLDCKNELLLEEESPVAPGVLDPPAENPKAMKDFCFSCRYILFG